MIAAQAHIKQRKVVATFDRLLSEAERGRYAVGSFSPRTTAMIAPVLQAGKEMSSPLIVQISQKELDRYGISPAAFAREFYASLERERITLPVILHLDHTKVFPLIQEAIEAGFASVMIDASDKPLEENITVTRRVVEYAHARGVAVEAELGRIGTGDFVETDSDEEMYTVPQEAQRFVQETGVDALAVSVGTTHGVYSVRQPKVDFERLSAIQKLTQVHLVLHGGSGVPAEMIQAAVRLDQGGVSKVNIATDLELAVLAALGREKYLTDAEMSSLPPEKLSRAREAVKSVVKEKIGSFLGSGMKA